MPDLYFLIFERQLKLHDFTKLGRLLFARRGPSPPPAGREQPKFAEFERKDFAHTQPRTEPVKVRKDVLDTLPADLQEAFVKSLARARQETVDRGHTPS